MLSDRRPGKQRLPTGKLVDWLIPIVLFLVALIVYSAHFLTAPAGISGDAARLGLVAADWLYERLFPFYIYHQFAPNPLIVYLQAPMFAVLGFSRETLRGVTVVGGALAVPASYLAARWLFAGDNVSFARRAGLIAGLGLALCEFFALFSRYGIEGALLPAFELMAVAFLWRGLRSGWWLNFIVAGVFVGISQYVYIVARFFPLALAAASIVAIVVNHSLLSRWRGLVIAAFSAALVALPQWILFVRAPYTFTARTQQAAGQFLFGLPDPLPVLATKWLNQLLMLGWSWNNAYNPYSFKPLLTPVLAVGLLAGIGVALYKRRDAPMFSLAMMILMLLPDLLAYEGVVPSATRVVPALPFVFVMAGLGGATIWTWVEQRPRIPRWVGYAIPLLVLLSGIFRMWDYTERVLPQVEATDGIEWRASLVEIAEADFIAGHLGEPILLPSSEYQRAPLAFLLTENFPRRASGMPVPLAPGEVVTVLQPVAPDRPTTEGIPAGYIPDEWVLLKEGTAYFLPPLPGSIAPLSDQQSPVQASNGVLVANAFPARWQGVAPQPTPLRASFANGLDLIGYQAGELISGQPLSLTLYWQPAGTIQDDVEVFVQLLDKNQQAVAGINSWPLHGAYRIRAWHPDEIMPLTYSLPIPSDLLAGPYRLIVGTFDLTQHRRIPLRTGEDQQVLATLKVALPPDDRIPEITSAVNFGDHIELSGYTLSPTADGLGLTLFWKALDTPAADYTSFVHVVNTAGEIVAQSDAQPLQGQYPTSIWIPGEKVVDDRILTVPPGAYQVYVGWYRTDTQERLPLVSNEEATADGRYLLGELTLP